MLDILVLYTTRALIMARAARIHPATNTRFRFRAPGKRDPVRSGPPTHSSVDADLCGSYLGSGCSLLTLANEEDPGK